MPAPDGFRHTRRKSGDVVIEHHGRVATVLRGTRAATFLAAVDDASEAEAQELMARATGNYRHGNERDASRHPRNRR